jgi:hypothetical protein
MLANLHPPIIAMIIKAATIRRAASPQRVGGLLARMRSTRLSSDV